MRSRLLLWILVLACGATAWGATGKICPSRKSSAAILLYVAAVDDPPSLIVSIDTTGKQTDAIRNPKDIVLGFAANSDITVVEHYVCSMGKILDQVVVTFKEGASAQWPKDKNGQRLYHMDPKTAARLKLYFSKADFVVFRVRTSASYIQPKLVKEGPNTGAELRNSGSPPTV
jgi:hypothetical protein